MITLERLRQQRRAILEIAHRRGAHDSRLFGSAAHGDATEHSDLDLLVRFEPARSLLDHGGLLMDLVSEDGLRERFRRHLTEETVPL